MRSILSRLWYYARLPFAPLILVVALVAGKIANRLARGKSR